MRSRRPVPHSLPACPGRVARLGLPAAPPGGADRMALFSLSAASWFPGWLSGAEGHPRRDGDGSAWSWFYWNILRAPPGLSGPGWGLCGGGALQEPPRTEERETPLPPGSCGSGLDSGGQRVRDTAEPEPHQNKPSGGAVLAPGSTAGRRASPPGQGKLWRKEGPRSLPLPSCPAPRALCSQLP